MKKGKKLPNLVGLTFLLVLLGGCATQRSAKLVTTGDSQMLAGDYQSAAERYQKAQKLNFSVVAKK